jgi:hypothetical protein
MKIEKIKSVQYDHSISTGPQSEIVTIGIKIGDDSHIFGRVYGGQYQDEESQGWLKRTEATIDQMVAVLGDAPEKPHVDKWPHSPMPDDIPLISGVEATMNPGAKDRAGLILCFTDKDDNVVKGGFFCCSQTIAEHIMSMIENWQIQGG